jgi:hypothetical protein
MAIYFFALFCATVIYLFIYLFIEGCFFKSLNFKKIVLNWVNFFFPHLCILKIFFGGVNCSPIFLRFFIQSFCQLALNLCFWSQYILHQHQKTEENIYLGNWVVSAFLGYKKYHNITFLLFEIWPLRSWFFKN